MRSGTALVFGIVALSGACATVPIFEPREWSATVEPRGGSSVRANVRAGTAPGQTAVAINLAGGETGGAHPWHVHRGTCATGGDIVGDPAAYPILRPTSAGAATATAHIAVQLVPGESYHVNVHRSAQALGEVIGCGDLR
jgi:superoxide dismutase, Cu-Zn family